MIGGLVDALLGKSEARVKPFRYDTRAGTQAIQQQAEQAKAGSYALAASARGGMGAAANVRGAQMAGVQAQSNALQQQRLLEQQAAQDFAKQQFEAEKANVAIAQSNANNLQRVAGLAAGAGMMLSDERAKKLEEENSVLRTAVQRVLGQPGQAQREMQGQAPVRRGSYYQPEFKNEAELRTAETRHYTETQGALEAQRRQEEQAAVAAAQQAEKDRAMRMLAEYQREQMLQAQAQRGPAQVAQAGSGPVRPYYQTSDYRSKTMSDERGKGMMGMRGMEFPEGVKPVSFEYREEMMGMPGTEPGQQYGVLAQDLEKSKEGATTVEEDPESGLKMVDTPKLTMLLAGKAAEFEERLKRLEGGRRG